MTNYDYIKTFDKKQMGELLGYMQMQHILIATKYSNNIYTDFFIWLGEDKDETFWKNYHRYFYERV